mmetsp:Transcript_25412/g.74631  ORF Transcript_25412/g.74631 Transcript_25412/m.74631 type:complete len:275 (-) Transcript_25412:393-1217(-)
MHLDPKTSGSSEPLACVRSTWAESIGESSGPLLCASTQMIWPRRTPWWLSCASRPTTASAQVGARTSTARSTPRTCGGAGAASSSAWGTPSRRASATAVRMRRRWSAMVTPSSARSASESPARSAPPTCSRAKALTWPRWPWAPRKRPTSRTSRDSSRLTPAARVPASRAAEAGAGGAEASCGGCGVAAGSIGCEPAPAGPSCAPDAATIAAYSAWTPISNAASPSPSPGLSHMSTYSLPPSLPPTDPTQVAGFRHRGSNTTGTSRSTPLRRRA